MATGSRSIADNPIKALGLGIPEQAAGRRPRRDDRHDHLSGHSAREHVGNTTCTIIEASGS